MTDPADEAPPLDEVREALQHAKNQFYTYAKLHRAKNTDEGDIKACTNAGLGEEMAQALTKLAALEAEIARLRKALRDIATFGRNNPGYGYSCSTKARAALGEQS